MPRLRDPDWACHCTEPAAEQVERIADRNVWVELGGCPRSWREAAAVYRRLGVTNLKDAVSAVLGPPIDPKRAMRGDIAMVNGALGIVRGDLIECLDAMQPLSRAQCAWSLK